MASPCGTRPTTDYNFTKQSPSHRDPLLELSQACQKVGIKFGLYFSNIDWEKQPENPWRNDNTLNEEGYMDYIHEQLKELLGGKYGEITSSGTTWASRTLSSPTSCASGRTSSSRTS